MDVECQFCRALHFRGERPVDGFFTSCCQKGRLQLPSPSPDREYPRFLQDALTVSNSVHYREFRRNICRYNAALSFASLGANITPPGQGPYCFKINGHIHHFMANLDFTGQPYRRYAQLYFMDSATQANEMRMQHNAN